MTRPTDQLARRAMFKFLSGVRGGWIEVVENERSYGFGEPGSDLRATVEIHDRRAYTWTWRGSTGLGEGYVEGLWTVDDLVSLTRIAARNMSTLDRWRRFWHPLLGPVQQLVSMVPRNTRAGAARNISAHYDLGNLLFESFLDQRMMYSAAVFETPKATLEDAQLAKLERICAALELGPDDHLLEIGSGWGGLAIHAASTRGCRVTTTTISREQHRYAGELVREAGLEDRIELLETDYRDLTGGYDKLVSIEMIEAVGWQYFPTFFEKCASLLEPAGAMFLQAIVHGDSVYELEKASRSFANTHVFPGGCLPSLELIGRLGVASGMPVIEADEISADYARTLEIWRQRFNAALPSLRLHGYDERFERLWNFYLAFSEGGFRERRIRDLQLVLAKPEWRQGEEGARWRSPSREPESASLSS